MGRDTLTTIMGILAIAGIIGSLALTRFQDNKESIISTGREEILRQVTIALENEANNIQIKPGYQKQNEINAEIVVTTTTKE